MQNLEQSTILVSNPEGLSTPDLLTTKLDHVLLSNTELVSNNLPQNSLKIPIGLVTPSNRLVYTSSISNNFPQNPLKIPIGLLPPNSKTMSINSLRKSSTSKRRAMSVINHLSLDESSINTFEILNDIRIPTYNISNLDIPKTSKRKYYLDLARELLAQPKPSGERQTVSHYSKPIPIPISGDIIIENNYYMLVFNVRNGPRKTELLYHCVELMQKGVQIGYIPSELTSRDDFEVDNIYSRIFKIFPKERGLCGKVEIF